MEDCEDLLRMSRGESLQLRESTYNWEIAPDDRSWFTTLDGKLYSEMSYRILLKKLFPVDWNNLKSQNIEDGEIEEVFTNRLVQQGWVKIGELDNFYSIIRQLNDWTKDVLYSFSMSILKTRNDVGNSIFDIQIKGSNNIRTTIKEISKDNLYSLKEELTFEKIYEKELVVN